MKQFVKRALTTTVAVAAITATLPTASAFAINRVDCGDRNDFVRVVEDHKKNYCYANKGMKQFGQLTRTFWASEIRTGNNDIRWLADGKWHDLDRWHVLTFPTVGTVRLSAIEIK